LDEEIRAELAAMRAEMKRLAAQIRVPSLVARTNPEGELVCLKAAAIDSGFSTKTIRRWAAKDPALGWKRAGQWFIDPARLAERLRRKV
jgi:hypothetical protein